MKARKVNEGWDRRDTDYPEPGETGNYAGFAENEYAEIIFYYEGKFNKGTATIPLSEIAEFYNLHSDEEITNEMIEKYEKEVLAPDHIEWEEEDEGPNPDDLRDNYMD